MVLIALIKSDDAVAFKEVYNMYHHAVNNFIIKKTQSEYLAEEVVQITFYKLWKYRKSLKEDIPIINQIFRIARTTLINLLKKEKYVSEYQYSIRNLPETYDHVTEEILYNESLQRLRLLIEQLPPMRRRVFELSRMNRLSYREISEMLSISTKTVENHINLALKFIRPYFSLIILLSLLA